jgi:hypothetical protein
MTNVIKDSLLSAMLERLAENSSLELSLDYNVTGYTLYLSEGGPNTLKCWVSLNLKEGQRYVLIVPIQHMSIDDMNQGNG